jgi:hypothetical protein
MTRRSRRHLGDIALAALVTLTPACADADTTTNSADTPDSSVVGEATLSGVVFDVHRDPG